MDLTIVEPDSEVVDFIETKISAIWTDRYDELGDFELVLSKTNPSVPFMIPGRYLKRTGSQRRMIIKTVEYTTNATEGDSYKFTGISLESILKQRYVLGTRVFDGNLQDAVETILNENIIDPVDPNRKIDDLVFARTEHAHITPMTINKTVAETDDVYKVISEWCKEKGVGFVITQDDLGAMSFSLLWGKDRSYDQEEWPLVLFSPANDNLASSVYVMDTTDYRNVVYVVGQDGALMVPTSTVPSGLDRHEMVINDQNLKMGTEDPLADVVGLAEEYIDALNNKGLELLGQNGIKETFEGVVMPFTMYIYNIDYFIGDIVQVEDDAGNSAKSRVIEAIHSQDSSGDKFYPTFKTLT